MQLSLQNLQGTLYTAFVVSVSFAPGGIGFPKIHGQQNPLTWEPGHTVQSSAPQLALPMLSPTNPQTTCVYLLDLPTIQEYSRRPANLGWYQMKFDRSASPSS